MASKIVVGAEIKVDGKQAEQSVGSFKKQLREANQELVSLSEQFGVTSKEAINAAKKVAGLKDAIGDAKQLADAFNPDAKFQAFGGAIQGVTSGFAALQGAQALFGSDSKELEETLVKVNAAMAFSQGINGIFAAKDAFKTLGAVIKANPILLIATIAIAVGTALFELKDKVKFLSVAFEAIGEVISATIQAFKDLTDWLGLTANAAEESAQRQIDAAKAAGDATNDRYDMEIKYAKAAGKETFDLEIKKRDAVYETLKQQLYGLLLIRQAQGQFSSDQQKSYDDIIKKIKENAVEKNVLILENNKKESDNLIKHNEELAKQQKEANDKAIAANKARIEKLAADEKAFLELKKKLISEAAKADELVMAAAAQDRLNEENNRVKIAEDNAKFVLENDAKLAALRELNDPNNTENKIAKLKADLALQNSVLAENDLQRQVNTQSTENAINSIKDAAAKADLENHKKSEDAKVKATADSLGAIADVIGKQTAAGKALAIAQALINTYQGASEVLREESTLPAPFSTISKIAQIATIIATGIKTVKAITSVKVPGGGGGGSVSAANITAPISPTPQTTRLDQNSINAIGNQAVRTFVVESDVTGNQEKIRRLNRAARIN